MKKMLDKKIIELLKPIRLRFCLNQSICYISYGFLVGGSISLMMMIFSRFYPIAFIGGKLLGLLGVCSLLSFLWSLYKMPSYEKVALLVDEKGLEERTITALTLKNEDTTIVKLQKEDAIHHLQKWDLRKNIPIIFSKKILLVVAILILGILLVGFIPTQSVMKARVIEKNREKIEEQEKKIIQVEKEIKKDHVLSEEDQKEIEKNLKELREKMKAPENTKELQKQIVKTKKEMEKIQKNIQDKKIDEITKKLLNHDFTKKLAESIKNKDSKELRQAMNEMNKKLKNMSKEDLEKKAKELEKLAKILKNNKELAKNFKELSNTIAQSINENLLDEQLKESLNALNDTFNGLMNDKNVSGSLNQLANELEKLENIVSQNTNQNENQDIDQNTNHKQTENNNQSSTNLGGT
ncbi:hypothetical protein [Crassaminicella profunda]|uniref:hypothetical protein n=1 Tax=Crassaminicella profunda TaxID=1286698 RepID=UPI001CA78685|nr:hypothetical protein [Crassaminicella profunda]QZY56100.1 hypothetical protein K7H06_03610 [Crassaminicella profunda]